MDNELTNLPDGGTRKRYKDIMFSFACTSVVMMVIAIMMGAFDAIDTNGAPIVSPRFDMIMDILGWWSLVSGSLFGVYALSENAKKHSFAVLNRKP